MDDKLFTIFCSIITFVLSLLSSYIMYKVGYRRRLMEEKYHRFYRDFYVMWDRIHQGRAFDFMDLDFSSQEKIVEFFITNYHYAPKKIRGSIYELKTTRLSDLEDIATRDTCNLCYRCLVDFMLKKEAKYRSKFINTRF